MGYSNTCHEDGHRYALREPHSTLWRVLKVLFVVVNVLSCIGILGFIFILGVIGTHGRDINPETGEPEYKDIYENYTPIVTILSMKIVESFIQVVIGFIGICRLNLRAFYAYNVIVVVDIVMQIFSIAFGQVSIFILLTLGQFLMMYYMIRELKRENGMV